MTYTNLELLRKELADDYKYSEDVQSGDGETLKFKLNHGKIEDGTYEVTLDGIQQSELTEFTIDLERGYVTFVEAPETDNVIEVSYYFSAFSDTELNEYLSLENDDITSTVLRCINILLMDSSRRFDYSSGQTELKPSQIFKNLKEMREVYSKRLSESSGGSVLVDRVHPAYEDETEEDSDLSREDFT